MSSIWPIRFMLPDKLLQSKENINSYEGEVEYCFGNRIIGGRENFNYLENLFAFKLIFLCFIRIVPRVKRLKFTGILRLTKIWVC